MKSTFTANSFLTRIVNCEFFCIFDFTVDIVSLYVSLPVFWPKPRSVPSLLSSDLPVVV